MQAVERKKSWDSGRFRQEYMTFWSPSHPVVFPHVQTDHWSKMKTMVVPVYLTSVPAAFLKDRGALKCPTTSSLLPPPVTETAVNDPVPAMLQSYNVYQKIPKISPRNMPQYRNVFNDRARRNFCYWLIEKKGTSCKGGSFGAYKTSLGLPKI